MNYWKKRYYWELLRQFKLSHHALNAENLMLDGFMVKYFRYQASLELSMARCFPKGSEDYEMHFSGYQTFKKCIRIADNGGGGFSISVKG